MAAQVNHGYRLADSVRTLKRRLVTSLRKSRANLVEFLNPPAAAPGPRHHPHGEAIGAPVVLANEALDMIVDDLPAAAADGAGPLVTLDGAQQSSSSFLCRSTLSSCEQRWEIENLPSFFDATYVGPPIIYSSDFGPPETPSLRLYLNLRTRSNVNPAYASLFLNLSAGAALAGGGATSCLIFKLSLIDGHGVRRFSRASIKQFSATDRSWGWNNFIERATLFNGDSQLLSESGQLTILCEVKHLKLVPSLLPGPSQSVATSDDHLTSNSPAPAIWPRPEDTEFNKWKSAFYHNALLADVTLCVDGGIELRAHKLILSTASPVFKAMFTYQLSETVHSRVQLPDLRLDVAQILLEFIYTASTERLAQAPVELLVAADKYQMDSLKELLEDELIRQISAENGAQMLTLARTYNAAKLEGALGSFAKRQIKQSMRGLLEDGKSDASDPDLALQTIAFIAKLKQQQAEA